MTGFPSQQFGHPELVNDDEFIALLLTQIDNNTNECPVYNYIVGNELRNNLTVTDWLQPVKHTDGVICLRIIPKSATDDSLTITYIDGEFVAKNNNTSTVTTGDEVKTVFSKYLENGVVEIIPELRRNNTF